METLKNNWILTISESGGKRILNPTRFESMKDALRYLHQDFYQEKNPFMNFGYKIQLDQNFEIDFFSRDDGWKNISINCSREDRWNEYQYSSTFEEGNTAQPLPVNF